MATVTGLTAAKILDLVATLTASVAAKIDASRQIIAGTGLSGGGDLSANRTLAVSYGSTAGTAAQGNDSRLSDSRTPIAHAASHAGAGSDAITIAESQVTNLVSDLAAKQTLDSDLTAIAALAPPNDDVIQRKAGVWTNRTMAQLKADLVLNFSDLTVADGAIAQVKVASLVTDLAGKQPLDSDLTAIAALTPANDDVVQRKAGVWTNRTMAQLKTDLALNFSDLTVADGSIAQVKVATLVSDLAAKAPLASPTFTGTVTAARVVSTPVALTDAATIAVNAALGNQFTVTLAGNRTLGNPSNSTAGQMILIAIRQDGTGSRTLTLDTNYRLGTDIPTITLSTAINKVDYLGVRYNGTDSKWDVIAFVKGF